MSSPLSPPELVEIGRLIHALHEKCITPDERARLEDWICRDKEAGRVYVQYMNLYAGLRWRKTREPELDEALRRDRIKTSRAPILGSLGDMFHAGTDFLSQSFVFTLLLAIGLPGIVIAVLLVDLARQPALTAVATVSQSYRCIWGENSAGFAVGKDLYPGQNVEIGAGFVEVTFAHGAQVVLEGPATFRPDGRDQGFLRAGRMVANVPKGAEGFTVETPTATIVDLGTEFAMDANHASGDVVVAVLKGKVAVSLRASSASPAGPSGASPKRMLSQGESVLARKKQYDTAPPTSFVRRCPSDDALEIPPEYVQAVKQAGPIAYWRFETRQGDRTPNEMGADNAGQLIGPVKLGGWERNHTLSLPAIHADRCMVVDPIVGGPAGGDYSIEFWMRPEGKATRGETTDIDPAGMMFSARTRPRGNQDSGRMVTVQRGGLGTAVTPGRIRFLHHGFRYDFAKATYDNSCGFASSVVTRVGEWHHVAAVKNRDSLSLYVDGRSVGTRKDRIPLGAFVQILVGQLMLDKDFAARPAMKEGGRRYFAGQLDEMAVYNRALSAEEVARHYNLVKLEH